MKPSEECVGAWKRPDPQPVYLVSHATHLENVPKMVSSINETDFSDRAFAQVQFVPKTPHRDINGLKAAECKLLYFACPLGVAWEKDCRYGSVVFSLHLSTLLDCFKKAVGTELEFFCLGTDVYKEEYSHKVLVVKKGDAAPKVLNLRTMQDLSKSSANYNMPIFCDQVAKEWFVTDRNQKEQMEFVFKFPSDVLTLEVNCLMNFVGHQTVCIPGFKSPRPKFCPQGRQSGNKFDHRVKLRYNKKIARLECAALFVLEHPNHPFCSGLLFKEIFDNLVEHLLKVFNLQEDALSFKAFFVLPYRFCVALLRKVQDAFSAAEKDSPSEGDIKESLQEIMKEVKLEN